jgi:hypothetical protein
MKNPASRYYPHLSPRKRDAKPFFLREKGGDEGKPVS